MQGLACVGGSPLCALVRILRPEITKPLLVLLNCLFRCQGKE